MIYFKCCLIVLICLMLICLPAVTVFAASDTKVPFVLNCDFRIFFQAKYKEAGRKEACSSLYSKLPQTLDTLHAKEASQLQSQVCTSSICVLLWLYNSVPQRLGENNNSHDPMPLHNTNVSVFSLSVQVKYKQESRKEATSSLYHQLPETSETQLAKDLKNIHSEVRKSDR